VTHGAAAAVPVAVAARHLAILLLACSIVLQLCSHAAGMMPGMGMGGMPEQPKAAAVVSGEAACASCCNLHLNLCTLPFVLHGAYLSSSI
jgi:hypothetical protein